MTFLNLQCTLRVRPYFRIGQAKQGENVDFQITYFNMIIMLVIIYIYCIQYPRIKLNQLYTFIHYYS